MSALLTLLSDDESPIRALDIFIITGQSNAEGRGSSASSPAAPNGVYISGSTLSAPLADPVGNANTGSMWPAWSNTWFAQTAGRKAAFVEAAAGGTGLLTDAGGQWAPAGALRAAAVSAANAAIAAVEASASYTLGDVYFVWCQGESDAAATNGTTVTPALYKAALKELADYFKAQVPSMQKMLVVTTGILGQTGPLMTAAVLNYVNIRQAQLEASTENALIDIVYPGALGFAARGLMADSQHYSQAGLNIAGKIAARDAAGNGYVASAPAILATTAYADASDANKSSRTLSHTFGTGAKTAILIVQTPRTSSYPTVTATLGGVSMSAVCSSRMIVGGAATNLLSVFVISSSSGLGTSGSFVVTSSTASFSMHAEVVEFADEVWLTGIGSNIETASATTQSHDVYSATESTIVTAVATASAAASGVTYTGATEAAEMSLYRGATTAYYTLAVGYGSSAALTASTISTTHASTCTHINAVTIAVRKAYADELA